MASLVSDFIINPVLRQARRFSEISRSTFATDDEATTTPHGTLGADDIVPEDPGLEAVADAETSSTDFPTTPDRDIRFEEIVQSSPITAGSQHEHIAFATTPRKTGPIPEDDGMGFLRARIHSINAQNIEQLEKAKRIHDLLTEGYHASKSTSFPRLSPDIEHAPAGLLPKTLDSQTPSTGLDPLKFWRGSVDEQTALEQFRLSAGDIAPTYAPIRQPKSPGNKESITPPDTEPLLGCQHYERNVKLQCSTCNKWYTCRFCHDAAEDHNLIRSETKNMLCMLCATPQRAGEVCIVCAEVTASYYCDICKLWENRKSKPIYHCNDCGICRRGLGLGKDFFHCKTCRACITTSIETSHKCIERSTDCDCPICGEYMFTSPKPVVFMPCGHSIHKKCYEQHMKVSYKCPICNKSLANMETQFRNLDLLIQSQPMPSEFRDTKAVILCNDCSGRCTVSYHWLGLKCSICRSYNTVELQILGGLHDGHVQPTGETIDAPTAPTSQVSAQNTPAFATGSTRNNRISSILGSRRRHSSNGAEIQQQVQERVSRSLSPLSMIEPPISGLDLDNDSDNDIFGFWASGGAEEDESDDDNESEEEDSDHDTDEEEEDENEIILIGHR